MRARFYRKRRGAIVPLVAICLVAILGMVALAIDIGMVAVAKTQAQNAADSAAMVGTRTFNQQSGYNLANVPKNAIMAATNNKLLGTSIKGDPNSITNPAADTFVSGEVTIEAGGYYFVYDDANSANEGFQIKIPNKISTEPYTGVRATISTTSPVFFGAVFGASPFNVKASAVAAHRPRDAVIIMDLSGSMRFQSCPGGYLNGTTMTPQSAPRNTSLNPDTLYPTFGHYSSTSAKLLGSGSYSTGSEQVDQANLSASSVSGSPIIEDFMTSGSTKAFVFDSSKNSYATTPGGDNYLGAAVKTVTDYVGATPSIKKLGNWERGSDLATGLTPNYANAGYTTLTGAAFNGYTEGPGYWGKTFFVWPPDPRGSDLDANVAANHADNGAKDWRQRFFIKRNTSTNQLYWLDHNNILFDPAGTPGTSATAVTPIMKMPNTSTTVTENGVNVTYRYCINYAAIFHWLRNTAPTHFPASMTTGRIKFYSSIPNPTGDSNFNNRFWTQHPMTDLSERFWKDYVDFMLGQVATGANTYDNNYTNAAPYTACIGNGDMFAWGTVQVKQKPDCDYVATVNNTGGYASGHTGAVSFNNVKTLGGTAIDLPGPNPITGCTAATPSVFTSVAHGLVPGNVITVWGISGTLTMGSMPNNTWTIATTPTANTFTVNRPITNVVSGSPVTVTSAAHGLVTGDKISISGLAGSGTIAASVNKTWTVTKVDADKFTLQTSTTFTGSYTAGSGTWQPIVTGVYTANTGSWTPAITAVSNTSPIVITTGAPHNIPSTSPPTSAKFTVRVTDVQGNSAANGVWTVTRTGSNTFSLDGSTGDGAFVSNKLQWWEPIYYVRFGYNSTYHELNPALVSSGVLTATPDIALPNAAANGSAVKIYTATPKYMDYADNPYRPKHQFWFGPQTFVDWLGNYTINKLRWPGNVHEAQAWACKVGISSAIDDIRDNHPNDYVGMTFFSSPSYSTSGGGQHNMAVVPLGRNYQGMKDSLWFPPSTVSGGVSTITPYDSDFTNVPRAAGGTCPGMGFMITYNLLSSSTTNLRTFASPSTTYRGFAGGLGRKGAARLVIFETDGAPNTVATRTLAGSGANSYYPIRIKSPTNIADGSNEFPSNSGNTSTDVYNVVAQICALDTASPPGYSSVRKTAQVYSLGYGSLFEPANTSGAQTSALTFLQTVQYHGKVAADTNGTNFPDWQRIYGDNEARKTRMQAAFSKIMQSGVQVSLIK